LGIDEKLADRLIKGDDFAEHSRSIAEEIDWFSNFAVRSVIKLDEYHTANFIM
jgi:hypothetical protein